MGEFLSPQKVLEQLSLKANMTAADFGSGSGGWAIPLAKILNQGKVFAIDILEEPLSALRNKAQIDRIINIETIKADLEGDTDLRISDGSCDLVLMTNLLFQVGDEKKVFERAKKILKSGGQVLVVDWKENMPLGPKEGQVPASLVKEIAGSLGFELEKEIDAGKYHYGLIFLKSEQ